MPELPEVETIVRQLDEVLSGRVFDEVEVLREKSYRDEESVIDPKELSGFQVEKVDRFAKYIHMKLVTRNRKKVKGDGELHLLIHLKMTGQLVFVPSVKGRGPSAAKLHTDALRAQDDTFDSKSLSNVSSRIVGGHPSEDWVSELPSSHTRIVARFQDGSTLYFNDMRVFGWWKVVGEEAVANKKEELPPDVVDEEFTPEFLYRQLQRSSRAVKLVILDQSYMGGMGNIYANDALFMAKIDPQRSAKSISKEEAELLHEAMVHVLKKGIELGGASYSNFVDSSGMGGKYQEHFLVYDREGKPCPECGAPVEKTKVGGRGTYFCPKCQD